MRSTRLHRVLTIAAASAERHHAACLYAGLIRRKCHVRHGWTRAGQYRSAWKEEKRADTRLCRGPRY